MLMTSATSIASLEAQVSIVLDFASNNFLNLNIQKCEIIPFSLPASVMFLVLLAVKGGYSPMSYVVRCGHVHIRFTTVSTHS